MLAHSRHVFFIKKHAWTGRRRVVIGVYSCWAVGGRGLLLALAGDRADRRDADAGPGDARMRLPRTLGRMLGDYAGEDP